MNKKKTLKFSLIGLGGALLAGSTLATSIALVSCSDNKTTTKQRQYVAFNANVKLPSTYASEGTTTDAVVLDPSQNQNAIDNYKTLLKSITQNDLQQEFNTSLLQFFSANEFENDNGPVGVEAEPVAITVKSMQYDENAGTFGKFTIKANVKYEIEKDINTYDSDDLPKEYKTQEKTITLTPQLAGKNDVKEITKQLLEWSGKVNANEQMKDALEDLREIYFGDRNNDKLEDIFDDESDNDRSLMSALNANILLADAVSPTTPTTTPSITSVATNLSLISNPTDGNDVKINIVVNGTNLKNDANDYEATISSISNLGTSKWTVTNDSIATTVTLTANITTAQAKQIIGKDLTITSTAGSEANNTVKISKIVLSNPTIKMNSNADRTKLDTINSTNKDQFVTITNPLNSAIELLSITGNKYNGLVTGTFGITTVEKTYYSFSNDASVVTINSDQLGLPNGATTVPGSSNWEDTDGVLNFLNNFINNINPYAKMAGWNVSINEASYTPETKTVNPLDSLWVPSVSVSSIFYPTIGQIGTTTNIGSIGSSLTGDDIDLAFDLQTLNSFQMKAWFDNVFASTADSTTPASTYTWTEATKVENIISNLKAFGVVIPSTQKVKSVIVDSTNFAKDQEVEIKITTDKVVYELEVQSYFFNQAAKK